MSRIFTFPPLIPREVLMWSAGLIILPLLPQGESICLFHNLGISFCPGCGLGRSIVLLYGLNISDSLAAHPLGIPALLIILHRIFTLLKISHNSERNSDG